MTQNFPAMISIALLLNGCANDVKKFPIIAHRAHGVGSERENDPGNIILALQAFDGAETDIRGDGGPDYALGHITPNGSTLREVISLINSSADGQMFSGKVLILDISDDTNYFVTLNLVRDLVNMIQGTPAEGLTYQISTSTEAGLQRVFSSYQGKEHLVRIELNMSYFGTATFTPPAITQYISLPVQDLPDTPMPKRVIPGNVNTRSEWRMVQNYSGDIAAIMTDVPKRIQEFQK